LGSYADVLNRVDSKIGKYFMSIPSVKGVFIGKEDVSIPGSEFQDPFTVEDGVIRRTKNYAGGIEAGITNGENIVVTTYFKPISTLASPLPSVDLKTKESKEGPYIRSDSVIIPAATVITECTLAIILMEEIIDGFGNDNIELIKDRYFKK
jgi:chorismate synthase